MPILFAPGNWEPRLVPDMEVKTFLAKGYRRQNPLSPVAATVAPTVEDSKAINVNTCSVKDLAALPGSSMLVANVVKSARPLKSVEDLIEATDEVAWLAIASRLTF